MKGSRNLLLPIAIGVMALTVPTALRGNESKATGRSVRRKPAPCVLVLPGVNTDPLSSKIDPGPFFAQAPGMVAYSSDARLDIGVWSQYDQSTGWHVVAYAAVEDSNGWNTPACAKTEKVYGN